MRRIMKANSQQERYPSGGMRSARAKGQRDWRLAEGAVSLFGVCVPEDNRHAGSLTQPTRNPTCGNGEYLAGRSAMLRKASQDSPGSTLGSWRNMVNLITLA
jgi:hypothetical protein